MHCIIFSSVFSLGTPRRRHAFVVQPTRVVRPTTRVSGVDPVLEALQGVSERLDVFAKEHKEQMQERGQQLQDNIDINYALVSCLYESHLRSSIRHTVRMKSNQSDSVATLRIIVWVAVSNKFNALCMAPCCSWGASAPGSS